MSAGGIKSGDSRATRSEQEGQEPEVEGTEAVQTVSVQTDAPGSEGEVPENGAAESAEQKPGLLSLDDLFDGAQGSSCSIDGICD